MKNKISSIITVLILLFTVFRACTVYAETNLIRNNGFETLSGNQIAIWGKSSATYVSLNTEASHVRTGNNSVKIVSDTSDRMSWTSIRVLNVIPGAEYTFSVWIQTMAINSAFAFKYECYDAQSLDTGQIGTAGYNAMTGEQWVQYTNTMKVPTGTSSIVLYMRVFGIGTVYCDDASCYLTKEPDVITEFKTDWIYYYSDWEGNGKATTTSNVSYYPNLIGEMMTFKLKDGDNVLKEENVQISSTGTADFEFPLTLLSVIKREYVVECAIFNNNELQRITKSIKIYKYDRPNYLRSDGVFEKNGKVIDPVYAYHVSESDFPALSEGGINVVQGYTSWLDSAYEYGIYNLVVLYASGKSAGHPDRLSTTISRVNQYKDHPGLFGWMVMDEPSASVESLETLDTAYKTIRDIDPNHPVFINMNGNFREIGKYADVVSIDRYPANESKFVSQVAIDVQNAISELENKKPVYNLLQAFEFKETFPTPDEFRNMIYRSLWAGAKGIGFYCYSNSRGTQDLNQTELWPVITSFGNFEKQYVFDMFVHGKYTVNGEYEDNILSWRTWKVARSTFALVINHSYLNSANATINSDSIKKDYNLEVIGGASANSASVSDGVLTVSIGAAQAALYKISSPGIFSSIKPKKTLLDTDKNLDFESFDSTGMPSGWLIHSTFGVGGINIVQETNPDNVHGGLSSVKLTNDGSDPSFNQVRIYRQITKVTEADLRQQMEAFIKIEELAPDAYIEFTIGDGLVSRNYTYLSKFTAADIGEEPEWRSICTALQYSQYDTIFLRLTLYGLGTVYVDDITTYSTTNLLNAAGFDVTLTSIRSLWRYYSTSGAWDTDFMMDYTTSYARECSLKIIYKDTVPRVQQSNTSLKGGKSYRVSIKAKSETATPMVSIISGTSTVEADFSGSAWTVYNTPVEGWKEYRCYFTMPEGKTSSFIQLGCTGSGSINFNDFCIEPDYSEAPVFYDSSMSELNIIKPGLLKAEYHFVSDISEAEGGMPVVCFMALYSVENGVKQMVEISAVRSISVYADEAQHITVEVTVPDLVRKTFVAEAFCWESIDGANPYTDKFTLH